MGCRQPPECDMIMTFGYLLVSLFLSLAIAMLSGLVVWSGVSFEEAVMLTFLAKLSSFACLDNVLTSAR
eukprot:6477646-Amphidinium_carterae.1